MTTDLTKLSSDQVLDLINDNNSTTLSLEEIQFAAPESLIDDADGKNTSLLVQSRPNSGYVGDVVVKYNRLPLSGFMQYGEPVLEIPDGGGLSDIMESFNAFYDTNLSLEDDVDESLELPEIDYVGTPFTLPARGASLAYRGSIDLTVKFASSPLSIAISRSALGGLTWPLIELDGQVEDLTPYSNAVQDGADAVFEGKLYSYGSTPGNGELRIYDFSTSTWTNGSAYINNYHNGMAEVGGKLYTFGGLNALRKYAIYDIATDTWTAGSKNTPTDMWRTRAVSVGRDIYLFGNMTSNALYKYNVDDDTFTKLSNGPTVHSQAFSHYKGKLYTFGGTVGVSSTAASYAYDIATDTWSQVRNMPRAASGISAVTVGDYLYTYGGMVAGAIYNNLLRYHPTTDTWFDYGDIGIGPKSAYGMSLYEDNIVIFGGNTTSSGSASSLTLYRIS